MLRLTICASVLIAAAFAQSGTNYQTGDGQTRSESIDREGNVRGQYSYVDPTGKTITTKYSAGKNGFQVEGDHIPKSSEATSDASTRLYSDQTGQYNDQTGQYNDAQLQQLPQGAQLNPSRFTGITDAQVAPQQLPTAANAQFNPSQFPAPQFNQQQIPAPQFNPQQFQVPQFNPQQFQAPQFNPSQFPFFGIPQQQLFSATPNAIGQAASPSQLLQFGQLQQAPQQGQPAGIQYSQIPTAPRFDLPLGIPQTGQQYSQGPSQFPPSPPTAQAGTPLSLGQFQGIPQFTQPQYQYSNEQLASQLGQPAGQQLSFQFPGSPQGDQASSQQQLGAAQFPTVPSSPQLSSGASQYTTPRGTQLISQQRNLQVPHRFN